jgi:hypothetical protein
MSVPQRKQRCRIGYSSSILHSLGRARRTLGMMESTGEGKGDLWRRENLFLLDRSYLKHLVILFECNAVEIKESLLT